MPQENNTAPVIASHVTTTGVKRTSYGKTGRPLTIFVNAFETSIPQDVIFHYDIIPPADKVLPARVNMTLLRELQTRIAPDILTPLGVYDGRKNFFSPRRLPLGKDDCKEFDVSLQSGDQIAPKGKGPKVYKIRFNLVAQINPEVLKRYIEGKQSLDNAVLTAITALNVVIRMEPSQKYPFNVRSFFTDQEKRDIGLGLELWRGYFQSVRPSLHKMHIIIDTSTATMYTPGPLISLCLAFFKKTDPRVLAPKNGLPDRERLRLQRFVAGIRVITTTKTESGEKKIERVVKKLSTAGASALSFKLKDGGAMTVAQYFQKVLNRPLRHPDVICAEIGTGVLIPLELCEVPPGQIMRKQVPPEKTKDVVEFATKKPQDRLKSIEAGLQVLAYGQSEYVRNFGMNITQTHATRISARVLNPPMLRYGKASQQPTIMPANGQWNMRAKKFYKPVEILHWAVVIYERKQRFNERAAEELIQGLSASAHDVGMTMKPNTVTVWENGQGNIAGQIKAAGQQVFTKFGKYPTLIVVVLPEGGNDIYTAVKHFGDVTTGVATQCLKSLKCSRAQSQYFANVCLKINVKLGGINAIPDPNSVRALADPQNPTIVMGADVIHPAPGSLGRPSFTALVASVDSDNAKYTADCGVQTSRQEIIEDLETMAKTMLTRYIKYRSVVERKSPQMAPPKRIIFYRDGVSEGQFQQVLDQELVALQKACAAHKIKPKITFIVVGKRHHIRFFPTSMSDADKSGNCPAGTVVDQEIGHPTDLDFYLQSHGGLLGTSRPAHYSVLHDENNFSPDTLQSLSFALCHVYARSTRSVSIPAPVYYADIVCSRAKNHYDPTGTVDFSDSATNDESVQADTMLEAFRRGFKPLNERQKTLMYFSVRFKNYQSCVRYPQWFVNLSEF
ncbi:argonaute-like protein [Lentinula raphanica]|uniref:Argonaute-like protein n=1 Tax=Lentinula raphanica TaxID=153919 RepID=A0AA38UEF0_9AGAR|nr:argonaute-like protein [Lentinula raphanica]